MSKTSQVKIEMLSTGDEVLYGQIVDTNAAWLSDFLFQQGFPITARTTAGDNLEQLVTLLQARSLHNDILIVNGGLGPTSDDLSALAASLASHQPLVLNQDWLAEMQHYYAANGRVMPKANEKQAMLPKGAEMIDNPVGTACGFSLQMNGCTLFFTPGVPSEFKRMIQEQILPRIRQRYADIEPMLCYRLTTLGRSESEIATELEQHLVLPENVALGYRAAMPIVELKLTGPRHAQSEMNLIWQQIQQLVGQNTLFEGTSGLPVLLSTLLKQHQLKLTVIEQYTAGWLAYQLAKASTPMDKSTAYPLNGADLMPLVQRQYLETGADLALAIGEYHAESGYFEVILLTQTDTYHYRMKYHSRQYTNAILQETFSMVALDILRRYLLNLPMIAPNFWLTAEPID